MSKKNVVIVAGVFYPEPVVSANILYELANSLSTNYNVTVLRTRPTRPLGFTIPAVDSSKWPFNVITLDSYTCPESKIIGRFKESRSMGKLAAKYIKANHANIDFIYNDSWHLFGVNIIAKTAVKYGIPYIIPVQDIYPESLTSKLPDISFIKRFVNAILLPIDRYNLRHAAYVHTISEKMVDILSATRKIPRNHFVVVRNWQDDRQFTEYIESHQSASPQGPLILMYLGNIGFLAGIEVFIEALKYIESKDIRLIIAGSGPAKQSLMKLAENDSRIEFRDVPSGCVPAVQAQADIMVLPVKRGFAMSSIPSKLPAYMFSGKPILASVDSESDTAKCIIDSNSGWIVEPENPLALAKQLQHCIKYSRTQLNEIGQCGRNYAMTYLSRDMNLNKLVNACIEIIEQTI